jgi:hypothetical protein
MNWQAVSAARLAVVVAECLPNVDAGKVPIGPFAAGRSDALPRHSLEKQAFAHLRRGERGHSVPVRAGLPKCHSPRRAV